MKNTILVKGYGQTCNNILQFAHFYVWGKENGVKVIGTRFCYKYRFFKICRQKDYHWFTFLLTECCARLKLLPVVVFDDPSVMDSRLPLLKQARFVIVTDWYMRKYELFLKYRDEIRDLFAFSPESRIKSLLFLPTGLRRI